MEGRPEVVPHPPPENKVVPIPLPSPSLDRFEPLPTLPIFLRPYRVGGFAARLQRKLVFVLFCRE
jgi:hypothetical protein